MKVQAGCCNKGTKVGAVKRLGVDIRQIFQQYANRLETVLDLVLSFVKLNVILSVTVSDT